MRLPRPYGCTLTELALCLVMRLIIGKGNPLADFDYMAPGRGCSCPDTPPESWS